MPAIDLARLKKQSAQLANLFDQPEIFIDALSGVLDYYVNRTLRKHDAVAPMSVLPTYRTPPEVLHQIESELGPLAEKYPSRALDLADRLWDAGYLETRLLAAGLLGRIPPKEEPLLARLTAWTQQVRDPNVRAALLTTSLSRMRRDAPEHFLTLVSEWFHPARQRLWSNGIQALLPLIADPEFDNLPPIFELIEPVLEAAPAIIQSDLADFIQGLYAASPTETTFLLKQVLNNSDNPMTAVTMRRILSSFPQALQIELRDLVRSSALKQK